MGADISLTLIGGITLEMFTRRAMQTLFRRFFEHVVFQVTLAWADGMTDGIHLLPRDGVLLCQGPHRALFRLFLLFTSSPPTSPLMINPSGPPVL